MDLVVPRTKGTQAAIAQAALNAGYSANNVRASLKALTKPMPMDQFIKQEFPNIPEKEVAKLRGTPTRPMTLIRPNDPYIRVYKTTFPRFELIVDDSVDVKLEGRTVTVTLPEGSHPIDVHTRR
jgi:hypothetical protein